MQGVLRAGAAGLLYGRPGADGDDRQCVARVVLLRAHAEHAALRGPRQRCLHSKHILGLPQPSLMAPGQDLTLRWHSCCEGVPIDVGLHLAELSCGLQPAKD